MRRWGPSCPPALAGIGIKNTSPWIDLLSSKIQVLPILFTVGGCSIPSTTIHKITSIVIQDLAMTLFFKFTFLLQRNSPAFFGHFELSNLALGFSAAPHSNINYHRGFLNTYTCFSFRMERSFPSSGQGSVLRPLSIKQCHSVGCSQTFAHYSRCCSSSDPWTLLPSAVLQPLFYYFTSVTPPKGDGYIYFLSFPSHPVVSCVQHLLIFWLLVSILPSFPSCNIFLLLHPVVSKSEGKEVKIHAKILWNLGNEASF